MLAIINPTMARVASIIKKLDMDATMRAQADAMEKALRDIVTNNNYFREKGHKEGHKEGRKVGREEGRKVGRAETRLEIVLNLLKSGLDISVIASSTGLSIAEIQSLAKKQ